MNDDMMGAAEEGDWLWDREGKGQTFEMFARQNKMYWIIPLILFLGFTALMVVVTAASAPVIYTLF